MSPAQWCILGIFFLLYLFRLVYLLFFTGKILFIGRKSAVSNENAVQTVSVLLTVRNEEENLKRLLPQLLQVKSVKYEVVVVDNYSLDNTYTLLGSFREKFSQLRISSLNEETHHSEKMAQNIGLKAACNEWALIFPVEAIGTGNDWLAGFVENTATRRRKVLVGYIGIKARTGWYNKLCRIEQFEQQIKSAGFIANGIAFVYDQDNVAFIKQGYFDVGGYGAKINECYASLELIVNQFIGTKNVALLFDRNTCLKKDIETGRDDFHNLLKRSIRIEKHLSRRKQFSLKAERLTQLLYLPFVIVAMVVCDEFWMLPAILAGTKVIVESIIVKIIQNRLGESKIFISSLLYHWFMPYLKMFYRWKFVAKYTTKING